MAAVCDICAKGPGFGHNVPWSKKRTKRRWNPNIQRVRAVRLRHPQTSQRVHLLPEGRQGHSLSLASPVEPAPPDRAALAAFASAFTADTGLDLTASPFGFGDSAELADKLAALVRSGRKQATASAMIEHDAEPPARGQRSVVYDGSGRPVCVIRTDQVRTGPLADVVDPAFAWDEGRAIEPTRTGWPKHEAYWRRTLPAVGVEFSSDLSVVLERFSVLWPAQDADETWLTPDGVSVRPAWVADHDWLTDTMRQRWDGIVVSRGEVLEPARLPALLAVDVAVVPADRLERRRVPPRRGRAVAVAQAVHSADRG